MSNLNYQFEFHSQVKDEFVLVTAAGETDAASLTNMAGEVVDALVRGGILQPGHRILYADTAGVWDELKIIEDATGRRRFGGFLFVGGTSEDDAVAKARRKTAH